MLKYSWLLLIFAGSLNAIDAAQAADENNDDANVVRSMVPVLIPTSQSKVRDPLLSFFEPGSKEDEANFERLYKAELTDGQHTFQVVPIRCGQYDFVQERGSPNKIIDRVTGACMRDTTHLFYGCDVDFLTHAELQHFIPEVNRRAYGRCVTYRRLLFQERKNNKEFREDTATKIQQSYQETQDLRAQLQWQKASRRQTYIAGVGTAFGLVAVWKAFRWLTQK